MAVCLLCASTRRKPVVAVKERLLGAGEVFTVVRCEGCGLLRTDPRPSKAEIGHYYADDYGPHQPLSAPAVPWLRPGLKGLIRRWTLTAHYGYRLMNLCGLRGRVINTMTRLLKGRYLDFPPFRSSGRLLEVGCATGERLALLRDLGWEVQGIEISERASRMAKTQYGLDVFCGELEEACLADASMDAVLMFHVIEHVHDPVATLREVRRILQPGGVVLMETPNARSLERWIFGSHWHNWEIPRHLSLFDVRTLGLSCAMAGFQIQRVAYSPFTYDWNRSMAYWCENHGWKQPAAWLRNDPPMVRLLLRPLCKLLARVRATGRMIVVAERD